VIFVDLQVTFNDCFQGAVNLSDGSLKELYVRLWPKLVLQSLSNDCRVVYPLPFPPDSRLPDRIDILSDTFVAAAVVTRAELATLMLQH